MAGIDESTAERALAVFEDEVVARGGEVKDQFHDGDGLYARAILPRIKTARPDDRYQGGVALRYERDAMWVHPYLFRLLCRNGAIIARSFGTRHLNNLNTRPVHELEAFLQQAVESSCAEQVFRDAVTGMRNASDRQTDRMISLMHFLSRVPKEIRARLLSRLSVPRDRTRFGLINAVTSTARDTPDPRVRWKLEEYAGELILAQSPGPRRVDSVFAALPREEELTLLEPGPHDCSQEPALAMVEEL